MNRYYLEFTPEVNAIIDGYFAHWLDVQSVAEHYCYENAYANARETAAAGEYELMVREARKAVKLAESARITIKALPPTIDQIDIELMALDDYDATMDGASWRGQ